MRASTRPRLIVLTCVWQRPALTDLVLRTYRRAQQSLCSEVELCLLAVGSEGAASRGLCEANGFDYLEHANVPLSHKWNAGVRAARSYDADGLIITGSDDLLSPELFRTYPEKLRQGLDFFGLSDLFFYNAITRELAFWGGYAGTSIERAGEPIGCGRCFSRRLLDATDWNLWPDEPGYDRLLDEAALRFVRARGFTPQSWSLAQLGAQAIDIKVGPNITDFDAIPYEDRWSGAQATDYLRTWFGPEALELAAMTQARPRS